MPGPIGRSVPGCGQRERRPVGGQFLGRFATGRSTHAGYLSPAELRLMSEWLDIGAQYFNNPLDPAVPVN